MDFCAGIEGGCLGFTNNNLECVGYREMDYYAQKTYKIFYENEENNYGNLPKINVNKLPVFSIIGSFI